MPLWLLLVIIATISAVLGFAGLGDILLWVGAGLLLSAVVLAVVGLRRGREVPAVVGASTSPTSWDRRAARLGWVTLGLTILAALLLAAGAWALGSGHPRIVPDSPQRGVDAAEAVLPVDVELTAPDPGAVLAVGLAFAAFLVGMAALQAAAAMRVLSRGRGLVAAPPPQVAQAARRVLGPAAARRLQLEELPPWPVSAIPEEAEALGTRLHCTVLIPAHDEEAVLGRTLASLGRQITTARPGRRRGRQLHRRDGRGSRTSAGSRWSRRWGTPSTRRAR